MPRKTKETESLAICDWCRWAKVAINSRTVAKSHLSGMGYSGPRYPQDDLVAAKVRELLSMGDKGGRRIEKDAPADIATLKYRKLRAETHAVEQKLTASRHELLKRYSEEVVASCLKSSLAPLQSLTRSLIDPAKRREYNKMVDSCDKALASSLEIATIDWLHAMEVE